MHKFKLEFFFVKDYKISRSKIISIIFDCAADLEG